MYGYEVTMGNFASRGFSTERFVCRCACVYVCVVCYNVFDLR